jgi:hypothetical protein
MTIDQAILRALESGPITVDEILRRLEAPVRTKLEKLRVRGVVMREGRGGAHRKFTFTLLHPDRAATALKEKGGLAPAVKAASDVRLPCSPMQLERSDVLPQKEDPRHSLRGKLLRARAENLARRGRATSKNNSPAFRVQG